MTEHKLNREQIRDFAHYLKNEERAPGTIEKYLRDVNAFAAWLDGRPVTRELTALWKEHILITHTPGTVNSMLASVNALFRFLGWEECRVKALKLQRQLFRDSAKELTREEYARLLNTARTLGRHRLFLLMETICATGIRVSEVKYITVEALRIGRATVSLKGKIRSILIPNKLCRKLLKYAQKQKIVSGEVFLTRNETGLSRKQIWAEMKDLCEKAGVEPSKVFPHNLRHLFARTFYKACKDVAKLADVLGHSSIDTTRIYLLTTGTEHAQQLERLGLVS